MTPTHRAMPALIGNERTITPTPMNICEEDKHVHELPASVQLPGLKERPTYLPADQLVERDEGQGHLEDTAPQDSAILSDIGDPRRVGTHEVDDVTGRSAGPLIVAEAQRLFVAERTDGCGISAIEQE